MGTTCRILISGGNFPSNGLRPFDTFNEQQIDVGARDIFEAYIADTGLSKRRSVSWTSLLLQLAALIISSSASGCAAP
jgi:hypothetical protein